MSAPNQKVLNEQFYRLLVELQTADFVCLELALYLDTHPNDMQAIQQFNQYVQIRTQLAQRYEADYGPLLQYGHSYSKYPWQWVETPWPWQV
jgi:spore coat protein JB